MGWGVSKYFATVKTSSSVFVLSVPSYISVVPSCILVSSHLSAVSVTTSLACDASASIRQESPQPDCRYLTPDVSVGLYKGRKKSIHFLSAVSDESDPLTGGSHSQLHTSMSEAVKSLIKRTAVRRDFKDPELRKRVPCSFVPKG